jgi:hypothetical protein
VNCGRHGCRLDGKRQEATCNMFSMSLAIIGTGATRNQRLGVEFENRNLGGLGLVVILVSW